MWCGSFHKARGLLITLNGNSEKFTISKFNPLGIKISISIHLKNGNNVLKFSVSDTSRPIDLNIGNDKRSLSIGFHNIRLIKSDSFRPENYPLKLNLGCGWDIRPGYLNVDMRPELDPDLVAEIEHLYMLPSGRYDEIIAQDCLEHLPRESDALHEWTRLLNRGGVLWLRVPDITALSEMILKARTVDEQERCLQYIYGSQNMKGDYHLSSFTSKILRKMLQEAGLVVEKIAPVHDWLLEAKALKQ